MAGFPEQRPGVRYLTEGGQETELMYKFGHELPEFAMYPLLDVPAAVADLEGMYRRYFEVAATHGFVPLVGGLDYRASPAWAAKLGISAAGLAEYELRSIQFLRDAAAPFADRFDEVLIVGCIGPWGDAYEQDQAVTADQAEDYHSVQVATLVEAGVDLVSAMTFGSVPEAIGVARATAAAGLPLSMGFLVDAAGCLFTGPPLGEAIEAVDAEAGAARPDFYGINCSHPSEFAPTLVDEPWVRRIRSLRPNASATEKQSLCTIGHLESGDPPQLGREMAAIAERFPHIDIWGGCCGTWDDHLASIAAAIA